MAYTVLYLKPEALKYKYIIVRDYGDGILRWSRYSSNDYEITKNCVDYSRTIPNLPYKTMMLETKYLELSKGTDSDEYCEYNYTKQ